MSDVSPLSGPEMAARMKRGTHVKRGADWKYGDVDGPSPGLGVVIEELDKYGYIRVRWIYGHADWYSMGFEDKYDLQLTEQGTQLHEHRSQETSDVIQLSGPEMADRLKLGTLVKRGADWKYGDVDGPAPGLGVVIEELDKYGYIRVRWIYGHADWYSMGFEDKYDLQLAEQGTQLHEHRSQETSDVIQLSGPEIAAMMKPGTRVKRGADWKYGGVDGPAPGLGVVIEELDKYGYIRVRWIYGHMDWYRMGCEGKYELQLAEPLSVPQQTRG